MTEKKFDETDHQDLFLDVSEHLEAVWPEVMRDWQAATRDLPPGKRAVALVTRDCWDCGTRVRVGAVMHPLSPTRPAGDRAYCAACKQVTHSPVVEVRGLHITDDQTETDDDPTEPTEETDQ